MRFKYPILAAIVAIAAVGAETAQDQAGTVAAGAAAPPLPTITMDIALSEAAAAGDDFKLVTRTLGVARSQRALDVAKQGFALSATGGYSLADGISGQDPSNLNSVNGLIKTAEAASLGSSTAPSNYAGIGQSASGGLSLNGPLTQVALSASYAVPTAASPTSPIVPLSVLGLTASQKLWDGYPGGQYAATLQKSALTLQSSELSASQGTSAAVSKVKQSYIAMLSAQRDLDVKKQVLDKQNRLLAQIQAVHDIKQASDIDLKTAQINAKSAEIDVATAEKTLRLANERLAVVIGRPASDRFSVADVADPKLPAASIDEAIRIGLQKRTDLAQYDLSAKSSRIDAALAMAQAQPTIYLTGGAGMALVFASSPSIEQAVSLGAKVSLPILDSGAAAFQAKTSEGQAQLNDLKAAQLKKTIASDIRDYYETAQLQIEKVELAKQSADLDEALFELTKAQNQYGTATTQDVLTASVTAATADENYETARSSYLSAELSLETAMGL
jgi:outer membrane protein TolC